MQKQVARGLAGVDIVFEPDTPKGLILQILHGSMKLEAEKINDDEDSIVVFFGGKRHKYTERADGSWVLEGKLPNQPYRVCKWP